MKRISLWLVIIIAPTLIWLFVSGSWRSLVSSNGITADNSKSSASRPAIDPDRQAIESGGRVLLPVARPAAPAQPMLHASIVQPEVYGGKKTRPLGLVVVDSKGRRAGFDAIVGKEYHEIANAHVEKSTDKNRRRIVSVLVSPATTTKFKVEIAGLDRTDYRLSMKGASANKRSATIITEGRAIQRTINRYPIDLDKVGSGGVTAVAFLGEMKREVIVGNRDTLKDICRRARKQLTIIKGAKLTSTKSWIENGKQKTGCKLSLTGDSKQAGDNWSPSFLYPHEGSTMYFKGWKPSNEADGPDGTQYRIDNGDVVCDVSGDWDGGMDDDPTYVPNTKFELKVSCSVS